MPWSRVTMGASGWMEYGWSTSKEDLGFECEVRCGRVGFGLDSDLGFLATQVRLACAHGMLEPARREVRIRSQTGTRLQNMCIGSSIDQKTNKICQKRVDSRHGLGFGGFVGAISSEQHANAARAE